MDLEERIKKSCYKLGGQIVTLDTASRNAEELIIKSELFINMLKGHISRFKEKELKQLLSEIETSKNRINYGYTRAIEQNRNIRNFLEKGEEIE